MFTNKPTYTMQIMKHLERNGEITKTEAKDLYGCDNISCIIFYLRKRYGMVAIPKRFRYKKWYNPFKEYWDIRYTYVR